MLRFLTAGESHGQGLVVILEGLPAGLAIDFDAMTLELRQRQGGYGRGRRMAIESDRAEVLSGVRRGRTTGAPVALLIRNHDWANWQTTMHVEAEMPEGAPGAKRARVVRPRPGHADLAGVLKYDHDDIRDVLERASARETAARVAAGAIARQLLRAVGCEITSHVISIAGAGLPHGAPVPFESVQAIPAESPLRCVDPAAEAAMIAAIDAAREAGDTLGGAFEVIARNVPVGLGSYVQWDRKLDGRLAQAMMSIHAIKAVAIGDGVEGARRPGSQVHDEIVIERDRRWRTPHRPADQSCRRARRRRHQRRGPARDRFHEADLDADEAAALRRSDDPRGGAGRDRAKRCLRRAGRGGRRRSDGGARPCRGPARTLRRRLDASIEVAGDGRRRAH